jgi:hypothetical protein
VNANTFASYSAAYPSGNPFNLPAGAASTATTQTAFTLSNGTQAIIYVPTGTAILGSQTQFSPNANSALSRESGRAAAWFSENRPFFNSGSFNARPFRLRASGTIVGGGTTATSVNATIAVYAVQTNVTTITSGTLVATFTPGTAALGNTKANWYVDVPFIWDSNSLILNAAGNYVMVIGGVVATAAAATAVTSAALTQLSFGLTYQFATSSTSNVCSMIELSLEQV